MTILEERPAPAPGRLVDQFERGLDAPICLTWELTYACNLACVHCRAAAQSKRSQFELTTQEGFKLLDQVAELKPKVFVITGGDPLKREDIYDHIAYAHKLGLEPSVTPSATPLLTPEAIAKMKEAGVKRMAARAQAESFLAASGVPQASLMEWIDYLKQWWFPYPATLRQLVDDEHEPDLCRVLDALKPAKIANSMTLLEAAAEPAGRSALAEQAARIHKIPLIRHDFKERLFAGQLHDGLDEIMPARSIKPGRTNDQGVPA